MLRLVLVRLMRISYVLFQIYSNLAEKIKMHKEVKKLLKHSNLIYPKFTPPFFAKTPILR